MCMRAAAPAEGSSPRAPQTLTRVAPHGTPACKHAGIRGPWPAPGRWAPTARGGFMAGAATTAPDARPAVRPRRGISRPPRTERRRGWASRGTSVPRSGQPSALLLGWRRALSGAPLLVLRGTTSRTRPRRAAATKYSRLPSSGHSRNGSSAAPAAPRPRPDLLQAPGHVQWCSLPHNGRARYRRPCSQRRRRCFAYIAGHHVFPRSSPPATGGRPTSPPCRRRACARSPLARRLGTGQYQTSPPSSPRSACWG